MGIPILLTHWGRVTYICISKLTISGSDNGLSPGRRQAIIWTNAGILLIRNLRTNFSGILMEIHTFSFKKMHLKMLSAKWRPFCHGFNVLRWDLSLKQSPVFKIEPYTWHICPAKWLHGQQIIDWWLGLMCFLSQTSKAVYYVGWNIQEHWSICWVIA